MFVWNRKRNKIAELWQDLIILKFMIANELLVRYIKDFQYINNEIELCLWWTDSISWSVFKFTDSILCYLKSVGKPWNEIFISVILVFSSSHFFFFFLVFISLLRLHLCLLLIWIFFFNCLNIFITSIWKLWLLYSTLCLFKIYFYWLHSPHPTPRICIRVLYFFACQVILFKSRHCGHYIEAPLYCLLLFWGLLALLFYSR